MYNIRVVEERVVTKLVMWCEIFNWFEIDSWDLIIRGKESKRFGVEWSSKKKRHHVAYEFGRQGMCGCVSLLYIPCDPSSRFALYEDPLTGCVGNCGMRGCRTKTLIILLPFAHLSFSL